MSRQDLQAPISRNGGTGVPRLSYVHNPGKEPLSYLTIGNVIENAAKKYEEICAIVSVHENRRITYKELLNQADKLAAGFRRLGLEKGDRIGLWAPNTVDWVITFFASVRAGLTTVSINPTYEWTELKYCLVTCDVKALICPDEYKGLNFYGKLCHGLPELESCDREGFHASDVPTLKTVVLISKRPLRGAYNYNHVMDLAGIKDISRIKELQCSILADDITALLFSSGTTGKPKAISMTHFQMANNAYQTGKELEMHCNQRMCVQIPLFHAFGLVDCLISATHFGTTLVFPSPLYNSKANLKAVEEERCTMLCGTPTMYIDLISLQEREKRKIWATQALIGAAPCSSQLIQEIKNILKVNRVSTVYGLTETASVIFLNGNACTDNVEYILDHMEAKVTDANRNLVPFGTPGELYERGYMVTHMYLNERGQTKEHLDEGNWFSTGDQFILYENGYGQLVGRLKDIIIRGGENISPREVEDLLYTHPHILEAYVIGIDHKRLGEELCACVRVKHGVTLDLKSLQEFCAGKIANYKIPSQLKIVETFPKTASGKIQKFKLREQINSNN